MYIVHVSIFKQWKVYTSNENYYHRTYTYIHVPTFLYMSIIEKLSTFFPKNIKCHYLGNLQTKCFAMTGCDLLDPILLLFIISTAGIVALKNDVSTRKEGHQSFYVTANAFLFRREGPWWNIMEMLFNGQTFGLVLERDWRRMKFEVIEARVKPDSGTPIWV